MMTMERPANNTIGGAFLVESVLFGKIAGRERYFTS